MPEEFDFDKNWLKKFSRCVDEVVGSEIKEEILMGSDEISQSSSREEVFDWTNKALIKLADLVDDQKQIDIMTGCACQVPKENLQEVRRLYEETRDINLVHSKLQEQFENFLNDTLKLEDKYTQEILKRNMGKAGKIKGKTIIATKIPKSAYIREWFNETDQSRKRAIFCHCPRIRAVLENPEKDLPKNYCYCGAGFYKAIWEEIIQKPVKVEILETVIHGGEVCKIAIHLPDDV